MDRSDVAAAVSELTSQKLIQRAIDHKDRRCNIITITPLGRAHLRRLNALLADAQDELLAPLSPDERQELAGMLTRVLDYHAGPRTPQPGEQPGPPAPGTPACQTAGTRRRPRRLRHRGLGEAVERVQPGPDAHTFSRSAPPWS
jgi:hypothetical protein